MIIFVSHPLANSAVSDVVVACGPKLCRSSVGKDATDQSPSATQLQHLALAGPGQPGRSTRRPFHPK